MQASPRVRKDLTRISQIIIRDPWDLIIKGFTSRYHISEKCISIILVALLFYEWLEAIQRYRRCKTDIRSCQLCDACVQGAWGNRYWQIQYSKRALFNIRTLRELPLLKCVPVGVTLWFWFTGHNMCWTLLKSPGKFYFVYVTRFIC